VCHVGVVFALPIEAGGLVDRLAGAIGTHGAGFVAREGGLDGRRVVIVESGAGQTRAAQATEALILGHRPRWIVSAGFAGGLDERVKQGDILMADAIADTSGRELAIDFKLGEASPRVHVGRLLTVDRVIRDPAEKRALGRQHRALAVDMESLAVAEVCSREKVRFLSVRVIIDDVERTLPRDIDLLVNKQTTAGRLGAAAGAIFRRPSSVKDMWQLKEDALVASERLAKFLVGVVGVMGGKDGG
jgi:adenosylhomocysteine nucleosidase